jgi:hypothetical protein
VYVDNIGNAPYLIWVQSVSLARPTSPFAPASEHAASQMLPPVLKCRTLLQAQGNDMWTTTCTYGIDCVTLQKAHSNVSAHVTLLADTLARTRCATCCKHVAKIRLDMHRGHVARR